MGIKLLLTLLIILGISLLVRRVLRNSQQNPHNTDKTTTEEMVQCRYCGTYVPKPEAIEGANSAYYCSRKHRDADA